MTCTPRLYRFHLHNAVQTLQVAPVSGATAYCLTPASKAACSMCGVASQPIEWPPQTHTMHACDCWPPATVSAGSESIRPTEQDQKRIPALCGAACIETFFMCPRRGGGPVCYQECPGKLGRMLQHTLSGRCPHCKACRYAISSRIDCGDR